MTLLDKFIFGFCLLVIFLMIYAAITTDKVESCDAPSSSFIRICKND